LLQGQPGLLAFSLCQTSLDDLVRRFFAAAAGEINIDGHAALNANAASGITSQTLLEKLTAFVFITTPLIQPLPEHYSVSRRFRRVTNSFQPTLRCSPSRDRRNAPPLIRVILPASPSPAHCTHAAAKANNPADALIAKIFEESQIAALYAHAPAPPARNICTPSD